MTLGDRSGEQIGAEKIGDAGYQNTRRDDRYSKCEEVNKTR